MYFLYRLDKILLVKNTPSINKIRPKTEYKWNFGGFRSQNKTDTSEHNDDDDAKSQKSEREHYKKFVPFENHSGLRKGSLNIKLDILERKKLLLQSAFSK